MENNTSGLNVQQLTLPKGGGAIKGIGETFQPNSFSGTGNFSIPFSTSPARGHEPEIVLAYNSGAGNSVYGIGFSVAQPSISRRTEKGLPKYDATDVFVFAGSELVPKMKRVNGQWTKDVRRGIITEGKTWNIYSYLPRIEGTFNLIQHWVEQSGNESWWKVTDRNQSILTFGRSAASRIADPNAPSTIFEWLLQDHWDSKGNKIQYTYSAENADGLTNESLDKTEHLNCTNRYLQRIQYGNYFDTNQVEQFAFEVVFDYGERELSDSALAASTASPYNASKPWTARQDAFSSFKSGFEIRTRRICQNILMFHRFAELGNAPCLVHRLKLEYRFSTLNTLKSIERIGYRRKTNGSYDIQKTPTLDLEFSVFNPNASGNFKRLKTSYGDIPGNLDHAQFLPVDLNQEGIEGLLYKTDGGVFYFEPLGEGKYASSKIEDKFPLHKLTPNAITSFVDVSGHGHLDVIVNRDGNASDGFYRKTGNGSWSNFIPFNESVVESTNVFIEQVGLSGNGKTDLLLVEEDRLVFYESLGDEGYASPLYQPKPVDFPSIKRNFREELVAFSNVFGDGLAHRIRVANGQIECWPSLGYGKFGEKIILANAPDFGNDFQINRLFLADVDGSGTMDLIYVEPDRVALYTNLNGNGFSDPVYVNLPESYSDLDQIHFADVLGNGTSCLVFSKNDTQPRHYFYEFVGASLPRNSVTEEVLKPYLLIGTNNNMGAANRVKYASSVKFYLADKKAETPWLKPLPFPVQVIEETISIDEVTGARMVHKFSYHDGFYDHAEKEFRGFAYVESWDTETLEEHQTNYLTNSSGLVPDKLFVPPVYTRTWHHTGLRINTHTLKDQYYKADSLAYNFPENKLAESILMTADEETIRQGYAAMYGQVLRSEVYGLDESRIQQHPYTVFESNISVKLYQERVDQPYAVFTVTPSESIAYHYERDPSDPRIQQEFVLATDEFENVTRSCSIALGRRVNDAKQIYTEQQSIKATATTTNFRNTTTDYWLIGVAYESKSFELVGLGTHENGYCSFAQIEVQVNEALLQQIPYETAFSGSIRQSRMLSWERNYFWNDAQTDASTLGTVPMLALHHHSESAVFSQTFVQQKFNTRLTNTIIQQEGGYSFDAATAHWWNRGLVSFYTNAGSFYQPVRTENTYAPTTSSLR
ncbi:MAG: SpvB/TcaC N-terminal domain-containing protein, partial [Bacteroidia bacterium]